MGTFVVLFSVVMLLSDAIPTFDLIVVLYHSKAILKKRSS